MIRNLPGDGLLQAQALEGWLNCEIEARREVGQNRAAVFKDAFEFVLASPAPGGFGGASGLTLS